MTETADTSLAAFEQVNKSGEDVTLRRAVARALRARPMTTRELADALPERSLNALRQ